MLGLILCILLIVVVVGIVLITHKPVAFGLLGLSGTIMLIFRKR